jgi:molybdate transport system substrate-binding protein
MTRRNTFFGIWLFFSMLIGITGVVPSAQAQPETLTIAAANSLKDALRKVLPRFEAEHPAINVRVIYGPSQSLRKQIEEGAPVDIFLPSLFDEIDQLETKGLIIQGTKRAFAGTSLVLITGAALPAPVRTIHDLETVPVRRIAIGDPKTSSVGKVAAQFLKYSKLEPKLKSQYVFGEHSRAVLDLVAKGEAEVGVVYRTDAASNDKVRILDTGPGRIPHAGPLRRRSRMDGEERFRRRRLHRVLARAPDPSPFSGIRIRSCHGRRRSRSAGRR